MASLREQILTTLVTALNTGRPGGIPAAVRSFSLAIEPATLPHMNVFPVGDEAEAHDPPGLTITRRRLRVAVECRAKGDNSGTNPGDLATDAMVDWVVKALGALDPVPGLFSMVTEDTTEFDREQVELPFCTTTVYLVVRYQTKSNDISSSTWP